MQCSQSALARLSDDELLAEVKRLAARERDATADLVASLVAFDERLLYLGAGYPSLFAYCVGALGLSESAAYVRIEAARAARRFPTIIERLAGGAITLTTVKLLAPHLTPGNHEALLDEARGRTRREVEEIVARVAPRTDAASAVRKLPGPRPTASADPAGPRPSSSSPPITALGEGTPAEIHSGKGIQSAAGTPLPIAMPPTLLSAVADALVSADAMGTEQAPPSAARSMAAEYGPPASSLSTRAVVAPLAPERYKIQVTVGAEAHAALRRLQDLMRHEIANGDPAVTISRALTLLLSHVERTKWAATKRRDGRQRSSSLEHGDHELRGEGRAPGRDRASAATAPRERRKVASRRDERSSAGVSATGGQHAPGVTCDARGASVQAPPMESPKSSVVVRDTAGAASIELGSERVEAIGDVRRRRHHRAYGPETGTRYAVVAGGACAVNTKALAVESSTRCRQGVTSSGKDKTDGAAFTEPGSERVDAASHGGRASAGAATATRPRRARSRYIPAAVRRTVWRRDQGRCTFIGTDGRCGEAAMLEYHHCVPFADGGETTESNIRMLCKLHNGLEADRLFGGGEPPGNR